jgi:hypothetical protein
MNGDPSAQAGALQSAEPSRLGLQPTGPQGASAAAWLVHVGGEAEEAAHSGCPAPAPHAYHHPSPQTLMGVGEEIVADSGFTVRSFSSLEASRVEAESRIDAAPEAPQPENGGGLLVLIIGVIQVGAALRVSGFENRSHAKSEKKTARAERPRMEPLKCTRRKH